MQATSHGRRSTLSLLLRGMVLAGCALPASAQTPVAQLATPEALVCAPRLAPDASTPAGVIVGAPDVPGRQLFGAGDAVLLNVGRAEGLSVGTQLLYAADRRPVGSRRAHRCHPDRAHERMATRR